MSRTMRFGTPATVLFAFGFVDCSAPAPTAAPIPPLATAAPTAASQPTGTDREINRYSDPLWTQL